MERHLTPLLVLLWLALAPVSARADGKVFPPAGFAQPTIPDQQALICYGPDTTEILVIDTSFVGEGTNFCWIVPLPSIPEIRPGTEGLFPTLQMLFSPRVITSPARLYIAFGLAGLAVISLIWGVRRRRLAGVLALWLIGLISTGLILPALSTGGVSGSAGASSITVYDRQTVGVFDTVTLSGKKAAEVIHWLTSNGFGTSDTLEVPLQYYADKNWVFVASKLSRRSAESSQMKVHPLIFIFETDRPVYPLRLTGVDNTECKIDLFVFGPSEARAPQFETVMVAAVHGNGGNAENRSRAERLEIRHPLLRELAGSAQIGTRLSAELTPDEMEEDAWLEWIEPDERRPVLHSSESARTNAANFAIGILATGFVLLYWRSPSSLQTLLRAVLWLAVSAAAAWMLVWICLKPAVAIHTAKVPGLRNRSLHRNLALLIQMDVKEVEASLSDVMLNREWLEERARRNARAYFRTGNPFTGLPIQQVDSPGNFQLEETEDGGFEYVWFDIYGGAHGIQVYHGPSSKP